MSGVEAAEAGEAPCQRPPLLFRVVTATGVLSVPVEFPYVAYECQVLYMQSVLDALFKASQKRCSDRLLSHSVSVRKRAAGVTHRHRKDAVPALRVASLEAALFRQQRWVTTPSLLVPPTHPACSPRPSNHILLAHAWPGELLRRPSCRHD